MMIYAVDFDGTLCENSYPAIGKPNIPLILHFKTIKAMGHKLILWTCREGELLTQAVEWCKQWGVEFDAVNENLPELIKKFGNDCRKMERNIADDKNICRCRKSRRPPRLTQDKVFIGSVSNYRTMTKQGLKRKYERFR